MRKGFRKNVTLDEALGEFLPLFETVKGENVGIKE